MSRRAKQLLAALVLVGLVTLGIGLYGVLTQDETAAAPTEESLLPAFEAGPAPPIAGTTLAGGAFDLADLRGTPVVVNFWATWCAPCRKELPAIAAWAKANPDVRVVGVDYEDDVADARAFADELGATWPMVVDADGRIGEAYGIPGLPATFLIDAEGRIVDRILGEVTEATLDERAKALTA
jgi:DsbE subfamily thiol:disulfide oxidoreductase